MAQLVLRDQFERYGERCLEECPRWVDAGFGRLEDGVRMLDRAQGMECRRVLDRAMAVSEAISGHGDSIVGREVSERVKEQFTVPVCGQEGSWNMEWKVVSERPLYQDEWFDVRVADVELPDGCHLAYRIVRTQPGAGVVAVDKDRRVLLIWRHRFITGSWGWESPIGKVEDGETPEQAAAREFEEETGWRTGALQHLINVRRRLASAPQSTTSTWLHR